MQGGSQFNLLMTHTGKDASEIFGYKMLRSPGDSWKLYSFLHEYKILPSTKGQIPQEGGVISACEW